MGLLRQRRGRALAALATCGLLVIPAWSGGGQALAAQDLASGVTRASAAAASLVRSSGGEGTAPDQAPSFHDVSESHWAYAAIAELAAKGIVAGFPDGNYQPDGEVTRAQFLSMLLHAMGEKPQVTPTQPYPDISADAWYAGAFDLAAQMGLTSGIFEGQALPDTPIHRQEAITILMRGVKARRLGQIGTRPAEPREFSDQATIATWAQNAASDAALLGIIHGYPDGTFRPLGTLTRAESAVIIRHIVHMQGSGQQPPPV